MRRTTPESFDDCYEVVPESGCWIWMHTLLKGGYGQFRLNGKRYLAHRWAYQHWHGKIPASVDVCHTCDVPCCVNPAHLFLGTRKDNMQDASKKGRVCKGSEVTTSKLREDQIPLIRADARTQREIADEYGITQGHVSDIKLGRRWAHIT